MHTLSTLREHPKNTHSKMCKRTLREDSEMSKSKHSEKTQKTLRDEQKDTDHLTAIWSVAVDEEKKTHTLCLAVLLTLV